MFGEERIGRPGGGRRGVEGWRGGGVGVGPCKDTPPTFRVPSLDVVCRYRRGEAVGVV